MGRIIDIDDERFWDILFDEACVEGQQANRIKNELEKIIAYDVEKVVAELKELSIPIKESYMNYTEEAIEIVRKGGVE